MIRNYLNWTTFSMGKEQVIIWKVIRIRPCWSTETLVVGVLKTGFLSILKFLNQIKLYASNLLYYFHVAARQSFLYLTGSRPLQYIASVYMFLVFAATLLKSPLSLITHSGVTNNRTFSGHWWDIHWPKQFTLLKNDQRSIQQKEFSPKRSIGMTLD